MIGVGKTAFLFPGQGDQQVGMGKSFSDDPRVVSLYETASEVVGYDLQELVLEGPETELSRTERAQPAIFTDSLARHRILVDRGLEPDCLVGHSLGEFSSLVAAGSLSFEEGIRIVKRRGELCRDLEVNGSMLAVLGLRYSKVEEMVNRMDEPVTVANYNAPRQVVISGKEKDLEHGRRRLESQGAKCIPLDVTGPFHSSFMKKAEEKLGDFLQSYDFGDPSVPVLSGVSGSFETSGERLAELITRQMTSPVRWVDYIEVSREFGVDSTVEVGPDKTLTKLSLRIAPELEGESFDEVI